MPRRLDSVPTLTSPRIVKLIHEKFGIKYNANYFCRWLHRNHFSLQKPAKRATQRDEARIASWTKIDWPRIVKKGNPKMPMSY
ncbi:MAG: winged helix-turn-helix domain-containing protein [Gemmataceae bacterium]